MNETDITLTLMVAMMALVPIGLCNQFEPMSY